MTRDPLANARTALAALAQRRVLPSDRTSYRLDVERRGDALRLVEYEAQWIPEIGPEWSRRPVARVRLDPKVRRWVLWWQRANGRWHRYGDYARLSRVIAELENDPQGAFWG